LGRLTGVRAMVRIPVPVARVAIGPVASEVFGGLRVLPARLEQAGFTFGQPNASPVLAAAFA
jgi:NAD dependent epimerase/dehydratase family enzyme